VFTDVIAESRQQHDGKLQNHVTKPATIMYQSVGACSFLHVTL
jgi:hypothetical protein